MNSFRPQVPHARRSVLALVVVACTHAAMAAPLCRAPANLISNPGFESGSVVPNGNPSGWSFEPGPGAALGTWAADMAHAGQRSVRISAANPDDANWLQLVPAPANTLLYLGGWIRSDNVQRLGQPDSPGATVSVLGRWDQPAPTLGTTPWHSVGMSFKSDTSPLLISSRLGFWGGMATGTAWFDDLLLVPRAQQTPHPRWNILVLVYPQTDVTYLDPQGVSRHVVATMPQADLDHAVEQASLFVERDIPALTSGNMLPSVVVRKVAQPLTSLSPFFDGWFPAQGDVQKQLDPAFDSVIVIWEPRGHDVGTGEPLVIGGDGAVTLERGLGQTYTTMRVDVAGVNGNRNIFKQQWEGAIAAYFQTMQLVTPPPIDFNAGPLKYVNCKTGQFYVWQHETNDQPIANSIYNNRAGVLHDYFSGVIALADDPGVCLGIGSQAWAWGGPVTHSGSHPVFRVRARVDELMAQVDALQRANMLESRSATLLRIELFELRRHLGRAHSRPMVVAGLDLFVRHVQRLMSKGQLLPEAGGLLIEGAQLTRTCVA